MNAVLTKQRFEADIETRLATVVTIAKRVISNAEPREAREGKAQLDQQAVDWLRADIDASQDRLLAHGRKLKLDRLVEQLDLGRDRVLKALAAELASLAPSALAPITAADSFVDPIRLDELKDLSPTSFDVSRLVRLCEELNISSRYSCFHAVAFLTRSILDHIPPLFGCKTFAEVANNYSGGRSFKKVAEHLESASRKVSDGLLHMPIRSSESLPTMSQVDVRQQLDTVLAEAVRFNRAAGTT